jgi:hypothetical protein
LVDDAAIDRLARAFRLAALAGLDGRHHHRATDLLIEVASDRSEDGWHRVEAARHLVVASRHHLDRCAQLLTAIGADTSLRAWDRRRAADALARLGAQARCDAADLLLTIAEDLAADSWERAEAATALTELDRHRRRGIDLLEHLATDPATSAAQRLHAARSVWAFAPDHAAAALDAICLDPSAGAQDRRRAAGWLSRSGTRFRPNGLDQLSRQATDGAETPFERALARRDLVEAQGAESTDVVDTMTQLAGDMSLPPSHRRRSAVLLAGYGGRHRAEAEQILRQLLHHEADGGFEEAMVRYEIARLTGKDRAAAAEALVSLDAARLPDTTERREAAEALATVTPVHRFSAVHALRVQVVDASADADARLEAAQALAGLTGHSGRVIDLSPTGDMPDDLG